MKTSWTRNALVAALVISFLLPTSAEAWWLPKKQATPPPVVTPMPKQLPEMLADGHDLSCIHELGRVRDFEAWKAAKTKYYEKTSRPFPHRAWGAVAWAFIGGLGAMLATRLGAQPEHLWGAAIAVPVGMFVADFLSAFYHKFLDSFADEKNAWYGHMARDFRVHHEDPNQIHGATYWQRLADTGRPFAPVLLATIGLLHWNVISPELATGIWSFFLVGLHGPIFHQYAHAKKPPAVAALLQSLHLALRREAHMAHHRAPFEETFGIVNGWSEPVAKITGLWKRLDRLYWRVYRRMPSNWIQDPRSIPEHVMAELRADFQSIPVQLWGYSLTAHPARVPDVLKEPLARVRARWRTEFIALRQKEYREVAEHDRALATRLWKDELEEFAWIYGPDFFDFDSTPKAEETPPGDEATPAD